jgi:hypothetical protein
VAQPVHGQDQLDLLAVDLHQAAVGRDAQEEHHRQQHQRQGGGLGSEAGGISQQGQRDGRGRQHAQEHRGPALGLVPEQRP